MKVSLICVFGIAVFVGFGEGITWIITPVLWTGGIAVALALVVWARPARPALGGRHVHGSGRNGEATKQDLWRHENGHARLLRKYGVGVAMFGQRVWSPQPGVWQGYTEPASWSRFDRLPVEKQVAIYAAGGVAMGSHSHDGSDDVNIKAVLKQVPGRDRSRVERTGRSLARRDL
jgi:hypothetical protein